MGYNPVQLCSLTLLASLSILLRSATKITHKAQDITGLVAKWHVCATLDAFDGVGEGEPASAQVSPPQMLPHVGTDGESEGDDTDDEEDDINTTKLIPSYAYSTLSYQKRQALGTTHTPDYFSKTHFFIITHFGPIYKSLLTYSHRLKKLVKIS